jgi:hypothetical protein
MREFPVVFFPYRILERRGAVLARRKRPGPPGWHAARSRAARGTASATRRRSESKASSRRPSTHPGEKRREGNQTEAYGALF